MTSTTMASDLAREALEPGTRWKHKKRGSTYELVGKAQVQAGADRPLTDYEIVTVYRCEADGDLWVRRISEFLDGRFELLPRTAYDAIGSGVKAPAITAAMVKAFYEATEVTREGSIRNIKEGLAAAISCISTHRAAGAGPACICQGCNRTYTGDLIVPDDVWERIKPADKTAGAGLLCASCIVDRAVSAGIWTCARAMDGDAGAGPVGEAVAPDAIYAILKKRLESDRLCEGHLAYISREISPLYAQPVDEPGVVERLRADLTYIARKIDAPDEDAAPNLALTFWKEVVRDIQGAARAALKGDA